MRFFDRLPSLSLCSARYAANGIPEVFAETSAESLRLFKTDAEEAAREPPREHAPALWKGTPSSIGTRFADDRMPACHILATGGTQNWRSGYFLSGLSTQEEALAAGSNSDATCRQRPSNGPAFGPFAEAQSARQEEA